MQKILQGLFDKHGIGAKDRYEISQIFSLLPEVKKQNILTNFGVLTLRIRKIQEEISLEQEILIGNAVSSIRQVIAQVKAR